MYNENELLDIMMIDMIKQKDIYRPGAYWINSAMASAKAMRQCGILNFRSDDSGIIGQGYTDNVVKDPAMLWGKGRWHRKFLKKIADNLLVRRFLLRQYLEYINSYYDKYKKYEDYFIGREIGLWINEMIGRNNFPDTLVGGCVDTYDINDKKISKHYIRHLARIYNWSSRVDFTKAKTVFEIGGGFGANIHLLIHMFPGIRKILYLDVPPMLYIGTQYLKHFFSKSVIDYRQTRKLQELKFSDNNDLEIFAIAPWQIDMVKSEIDLFFNCSSFQEMPFNVVKNYSNFIPKLSKPETYLCLQVYKNGVPELTINSNEILKTFNKNYVFEKVEPIILNELVDDELFVGKFMIQER